MNINIDFSGILTYILFLSVLYLLIWAIFYIVKRKKKIEDIKINPFAPIFGLFFIIALWLGDLTTLELGTTGINTMVGLSPVYTSKVPALFVWIVAIATMFFINYFFHEINYRKENKKLYSFNKMLVYTQLLGLVFYFLSSLAIAIFGYESAFLGFYLLNVYHATLPLIIITTFVLSVDIK